MASYSNPWRIFLVLLILNLTKSLANDGNSDCISDNTGGQDELSVKCMVQNLNDVFDNFSSIQPDRVVKLKVICDNRPFQVNSKPNSRFNDDLDDLVNNTFGLLKNLRELEIEDCTLTSIPPLAFNGVSQLKNLTIRSRNYRHGKTSLQLSAETFSQLQLLEHLDIGENNINHLPQTLLCPLRRLETLNLTLNNLSDISSVGLSAGSRDNVLCLVDVQRVRLSHNRIKVLTSKGFAAVNQLKELRLDHNSISRAEESALHGLDKLRFLDLSSNQIVALPPLVLRNCEELVELYLQNNSISVLPPGLFTGLQQLQILDLSHNEITSHWLGSDTFADLIRMTTMDVSYNRLTQIDSTIFRSQYSLEVLHLDHNEIEVISDHAFSSLYKLHTLVLNNNRLTRVTPTMFSGLYVLNMLSLSHNDISDVHPDAFRNNSAVMELSLANNKLTAVPTAVQSFQLLRSLDLSNNRISDIHNASYLGLENLYSLVLSGNKIGNLTKGVFEELPSLRILSLANNEIEYVETSTFDDVTYLHALRLDSNFLPEVNGLFSNLHDLMMLNISANRIEWFDYALVPIGLQWLDMHDNQIELLGNYFELEGVLKLRTLDVSKNHIVEIDSSSLPNGIEIVFLNDNRIKIIHPFTFMGKPNLTRVDLTRNLLENLEVNAFRLTEVRNRKPLPEFSISENPYLCDCNMEWIQRIGSLDESRQYPRIVDIEDISCQLTFNRMRTAVKIVHAHSSQFLCRYKNHCFALCHCCEFDACDCEMVCPENCTCFYDQSWNTNIVDCSSQNHISVPRRIPMDVTELYLDGNDIPSLSSHTFIGRKNMRVLYMNNSNVHMINNRTFNGLKSLHTLYLQHNLIVALHGYEFERLVNLRHLYLSYNRINAIGNSTFVHLKSLEVLHLDHNYIVEFQVWNLNQNAKLVDIQLAHNPWACECQFVGDFTIWLQSRADLVHDVYNVNCVYNETSTLPLVEFNMTMCTNVSVTSPSYIQSFYVSEFMPVFIIVASVLVLLIIACVLVFVYRKRMRVWFFSKYGVRIFSTDPRVRNEDNKLFDAFVSYSKKDESFVAQVLAPELEYGNPHYRLCLHYRDLPVSNYLTEAIVEAMESSRRTVLVLSENFIRSEWCRYDLKAAHHEVLRTNKNELIVILIGPLSQHDLDPDLRLWLKSCTFLRWGDRRFWEKLRYALPDIRNRRSDRCHDNDHSVSVHI
ncbi:toll-like receptor Tollo [Argiope bruennichi]|uniref:toll-like receptor Tollo n=1 Tax=Argiope bruennichi TaxID=94029 RepID=UPI002493D421|nr:toll-like receptor Tollo [Argiope bruennichi]XP_055926759.1 toll-like receptor Tollo [Argiope bruennichi]